jgi:hypothetical protein
MPTIYTAEIERGDITNGKDFILQCAKDFAYSDDIKECQIFPVKIEAHEYYRKNLKDMEDEYARLKAMETSDEVINAEYQEVHKIEIEQYEAIIKRREDLAKKFEGIIAEVEKWQPEADELKMIKGYALDRLHDAITRDYDTEFFKKQLEIFKKETEPKAWFDRKLREAAQACVYAKKSLEAELSRVELSNDWIAKIRNSVRDETK